MIAWVERTIQALGSGIGIGLVLGVWLVCGRLRVLRLSRRARLPLLSALGLWWV